jgi:hypothetical protein
MTDKTLSELFAETASMSDDPQARATLALAAAVLQAGHGIAYSIAVGSDEVAGRLNGLAGINFAIQDLRRRA